MPGTRSSPRVVIAGERSGVGKSTITIGILAALRSRGLAVQLFWRFQDLPNWMLA
ncbi:MAG TPA: hypothetical protein VMB46_09830 [Methanomassiliicoccales archaeon]|nr:hypothetical protein [Methanomassiliicoccales archaeon]